MTRGALILFALVSAWGCGGDGGGAAGDDAAGDTDTDADGDGDSDADGGGDTSSDTEEPCDGECASSSYTACTCAPDDPCDWAEDGYCDGYCVEGAVVDEMFDDAVDCPGDCSGLCLEVEWIIHYVACTCAPSDPCNWAGNGVCDLECLDAGVVEEMFDDGEDCDGDAGLDAG